MATWAMSWSQGGTWPGVTVHVGAVGCYMAPVLKKGNVLKKGMLLSLELNGAGLEVHNSKGSADWQI